MAIPPIRDTAVKSENAIGAAASGIPIALTPKSPLWKPSGKTIAAAA